MNQMWKTAKQMTGQATLGTPIQIVKEGRTIQSPVQIAETLNKFYIDKIKLIRSKFQQPINDPAAGLRQMYLEKTLRILSPSSQLEGLN